MTRSMRTLPLASVGDPKFSPTNEQRTQIERDPKFSPTNKQWTQIERAYGHALTDNLRQAIVAATINFLRFEPFERAAEPVSLARKRLLTVQKAAKCVHDALVTTTAQKAAKRVHDALVTTPPPAPATTATFYAHHLIKRRLLTRTIRKASANCGALLKSSPNVR
jgi:hypothetical protein